MVGPESLAVLRVTGASSVFLCEGAKATMDRAEDAGLRLESERFDAPGVFYRARAGDRCRTKGGHSDTSESEAKQIAMDISVSRNEVLVLPLSGGGPDRDVGSSQWAVEATDKTIAVLEELEMRGRADVFIFAGSLAGNVTSRWFGCSA